MSIDNAEVEGFELAYIAQRAITEERQNGLA